MARATELKVRVPDGPGVLGEILAALAARGITLRAVNAWVEGDEGVLRLVADPSAAARGELNALGLDVVELEDLVVPLGGAPGALAGAAAVLGAAGVSITHTFLGAGAAGDATAFLGVDDLDAAERALAVRAAAPLATPGGGAPASGAR